ncbi:MAG: S41 family peptidase [Gammaproteobacteria bacterium]|nr:S41 family peptidase [Gammaproteobacteria bacterium]MBU2059367.1 S41 family peptidase [Gammaproteobacteria bacterium]MBU2175253.1 S41 family peptidase [Gammaproteobacteria bacterium]MBU2247461.1 S41 family peptidase [Gammaproteobacteria bacterium]MBU2346272.1 S41 family peptidase [Gammaproteobacteria bacterium]
MISLLKKQWLARALLVVVFPFFVQANTPLSPVERQASIAGINTILNQQYVFPETALKVSELLLQQEQSGALADITTREQFADQVGDLLRQYSGDGHLSLALIAEQGGVSHRLIETEERKINNFAFEQARILPGNVGYLKLHKFWQAEEAHKVGHAALVFLSHSDHIVIDLRDSGGGSPQLVQYLISHFVPEGTLLWDLLDRNGKSTEQVKSLAVPDSELLKTKPLYILQSEELVSAGEFFSYTLQQLGRAVLIGETSAGLAHYTGAAQVNDWLFVRIPMFRPVNPITGTNFEAVGVEPNIRVSAEMALYTALRVVNRGDRK